jgi:chromosome segregation protein
MRALMQDWLHDVFVADDPRLRSPRAASCPPAAFFVTRQGHVVTPSSVRFYAADSEQDGMLARQQEIENLTRQRAPGLLADEARAAAMRADAAHTQPPSAAGTCASA